MKPAIEFAPALDTDGQIDATFAEQQPTLRTFRAELVRNHGLAQQVSVLPGREVPCTAAGHRRLRVDLRGLLYPFIPGLPQQVVRVPAFALARRLEPLFTERYRLRINVLEADGRPSLREETAVGPGDASDFADLVMGWVAHRRPEWVQALRGRSGLPSDEARAPRDWYTAHRRELNTSMTSGWANMTAGYVEQRQPRLLEVASRCIAGALAARVEACVWYPIGAYGIDIQNGSDRLWLVADPVKATVYDVVYAIQAPDPRFPDGPARRWHPVLVRCQRYPQVCRVFDGSHEPLPEWATDAEGRFRAFLDGLSRGSRVMEQAYTGAAAQQPTAADDAPSAGHTEGTSILTEAADTSGAGADPLPVSAPAPTENQDIVVQTPAVADFRTSPGPRTKAHRRAAPKKATYPKSRRKTATATESRGSHTAKKTPKTHAISSSRKTKPRNAPLHKPDPSKTRSGSKKHP